MSDSYGSELCIYESLPSIAEPLEVIVIFDLSEHGFRLKHMKKTSRLSNASIFLPEWMFCKYAYRIIFGNKVTDNVFRKEDCGD